MKSNILYVAVLSLFLLPFFSCNNDDSLVSGKARLEVRLTDDPANYDAVYIDIRDVQINVTGDSSGGWQSLSGVNPGIYDLLQLVDDKDTLLAMADIPGGRLHQIRLILGPDNSVVVDSLEYPLQTPSAQQSGLKINIQQDVSPGMSYTILLDFDASKSIVRTGNKKYILKPVIRAVLQTISVGDISGYVAPDSVQTAVYALQGTDTITGTFTDTDGGYTLKSLAAGAYDLHYVPGDTAWQKALQQNIPVNAGQTTIVDTVILQK